MNGVCDSCAAGTYFSGGSCVDCSCDGRGSVDNNCDSLTGVCTCKEGYIGKFLNDYDKLEKLAILRSSIYQFLMCLVFMSRF